MDRRYCVYKHTNKINGKVYIGITSQKPQKRWDCGRGYKKNKHFWDAIQKYGWENFEHEILFENVTPDDAFSKEKELILEYGSRDYRKGYNISTGGEGGATGLVGENHPMYGKKHSREAIKRMSDKKKGIPYSPERYESFLKSLNREKLRERAYRTIAGCNKGKTLSEETRRKISESNRGLKRSNETKVNIGKSKSKAVIQLTKEGEILRSWMSARQAALELGIQAGHISKVCKNQRKTAGGFAWQYLLKEAEL